MFLRRFVVLVTYSFISSRYMSLSTSSLPLAGLTGFSLVLKSLMGSFIFRNNGFKSAPSLYVDITYVHTFSMKFSKDGDFILSFSCRRPRTALKSLFEPSNAFVFVLDTLVFVAFLLNRPFPLRFPFPPLLFEFELFLSVVFPFLEGVGLEAAESVF